MAVSTILITIQHLTARLLTGKNKTVHHFVLFLMNVLPVQGLQHYKSQDY